MNTAATITEIKVISSAMPSAMLKPIITVLLLPTVPNRTLSVLGEEPPPEDVVSVHTIDILVFIHMPSIAVQM